MVTSQALFSSKSFTYIINMIPIADVLRLSCTFVLILPNLIMWHKPGWFCKMNFFIIHFASIMSDSLVTTLAVKRSVAVVVPLKVKIIFATKKDSVYCYNSYYIYLHFEED